MFEDLTQKLDGAFRRLRGQGHLTEDNVGETLREIRRGLLEADVHYKVVRDFIDAVRERALGQQVLQSLQPGQQVVRIVRDELVRLLGSETAPLDLTAYPAVLLLVGLQGSGKTTFAGKLARHLQKQNRKVLLVAADVYRPAAIEQLQILGEKTGVPVWSQPGETDVVRIVETGRRHAIDRMLDTVIVDTAGRLHVDDALMGELEAVRSAVPPSETLLVLDAMTGQEALRVGETFDTRIGLTGICLSKLDGDARGGAALSLRAVLGKPISFVGVGEGLDDLEVFHPDRMAQRILGMGDVLTLVEKAQEVYDEKESRELEKKLRRQSLTLDDLVTQLQQAKRMGPVQKWLGMIPGMTPAMVAQAPADMGRLDRVQGIVHSMTPPERRNPQILDGSRRRRVARGSGTSVQEVNELLRQFDQMKRMMKKATTGPRAGVRRVAVKKKTRSRGKRR